MNFRILFKNKNSLELFNIIFENDSPKGSFGANKKKVEFLLLSPDSRKLLTTSLKSFRSSSMLYTQVSGVSSWGFNEFVSIGYRTNKILCSETEKTSKTFLALAGKLNLKKDSHCLTLLKIKKLFCHCLSTIYFITCIKQSKEKTAFCPRKFSFVI